MKAVCTPSGLHAADLLTDTLDVWQKHSGPRLATSASIPPFSLMHNCLLRVPICHQNLLDMLSFIRLDRSPFANPFGSVMEAVCNARLHLWMVVGVVVEVAVSVGGLLVHTVGHFASILFHMHVEERNCTFGLRLHGELDFCALTIQMLKEALQLTVAMFPSWTPFVRSRSNSHVTGSPSSEVQPLFKDDILHNTSSC